MLIFAMPWRELPLRAILRGHGRAIASSVLTTWMLTASIVVVILMTPAFAAEVLPTTCRDVQLATLVATAALCLSTLAIGALAERNEITSMTSDCREY